MKTQHIIIFLLLIVIAASIMLHYERLSKKVIAPNIYIYQGQWYNNCHIEYIEGHKVSTEGDSNSLNICSGNNNLQENNS